MLVDVDGWSVADILTHDVCLLDADGQAKFFTGISIPVYQSLKVEWDVSAALSAKRSS